MATSVGSSNGRSTPTKENTPKFCKRLEPNEVEANTRIQTQAELVKIGQLMEKSKISPEFPKLKTMSLDKLTEYVENKLSKDHYSPEVIYLLFQIQSLVLETENLNNTLNMYNITITEFKKDLVLEKTLTCDLKDSIRESTTELEELENEKKKDMTNHQTQYRILTTNYETVMSRKNLYEKILLYLVPTLGIIVSITINIMLNSIGNLFN